jgi:hypothetical protein
MLLRRIESGNGVLAEFDIVEFEHRGRFRPGGQRGTADVGNDQLVVARRAAAGKSSQSSSVPCQGVGQLVLHAQEFGDPAPGRLIHRAGL